MVDNPEKKNFSKKAAISLLAVVNAIILEQALVSNKSWYWLLLITIPALLHLLIRLNK
jgi:hypothetical protein